MTFDSLMAAAAAESVDERERYLIMFTHGANGYVCRNEGLTDESHALYHGTYRDCQVWIERRGVAAALACVSQHLPDVPELDGQLLPADLLARLSQLPK